MIIDCRTWNDLPDGGESERRRVFVDGVEIKEVWYLDTDAGLVETFDIYGDGDKSRLSRHGIPFDVEGAGVLSKTIFGRVELLPR